MVQLYKLADDFEAFVHVLCWMCLRFYRHLLTGCHAQFSAHVVNVFESSNLIDGERIGGAVKYPAMLRGVKMPLFSSHLRHRKADSLPN